MPPWWAFLRFGRPGGVVVEVVRQPRDLCHHRRLVSPSRRNRPGSVVGAGDLSVDRAGRVGVVAEVHR